MSDITRVFVYGTLKPGEINYLPYCGDKVIDFQPAIAFGMLYHLTARGYPGMSFGDSLVHGVLLIFNDAKIFDTMDVLETYQPGRSPTENEYQREQIEVFALNGRSLGRVWTYIMLPDRVIELGGVLMPNGWWGEGNPPANFNKPFSITD